MQVLVETPPALDLHIAVRSQHFFKAIETRAKRFTLIPQRFESSVIIKNPTMMLIRLWLLIVEWLKSSAALAAADVSVAILMQFARLFAY